MASDYRIAYDYLSFVCYQHQIPRPDKGHWQKVESGKNVFRKKLPDPMRNSEFEIRPQGSLPGLLQPEIRDWVKRNLALLSQKNLEASIPHNFTAHETLLEYRRFCSTDHPDKALPIRVRVDMQTRAERVANALFHFLDQYDLKVSVPSPEGMHRCFDIEAKSADLGLAIEQESGRMRLNLWGCPYCTRSSWSDGRRQLVEECFAALTATAIYGIGTKVDAAETASS